MIKHFIFVLVFVLFTLQTEAQTLKKEDLNITLPPPQKMGTVSLMQALQDRHSDHAFAKKDLSLQDLSNLLWVAYGVNRSNGKRTIPTAMNEKDLNIYVFNKDGVFLYNAVDNTLKVITRDNHLSLFNKQNYMENVPVVFVYTGKDDDYALMHAGASFQNIGLYTATNDMASIVRGFFDKDEVEDLLGFSDDDEEVLISQAIGWKE